MTQIKFVPVTAANKDVAITVGKLIFQYEEDQNTLKSHFEASIDSTKWTPVMKNDLASLEYFIALKTNPKTEKDEAIGITGIYTLMDGRAKDEAWMGWFGLLTEQRGQGLGKQMLNEMSYEVARRGFKIFGLWTTLNSEETKTAVNMYRGSGWDEEVTSRQIKYGDEHFPVAIYRKSLVPGVKASRYEESGGDLRKAFTGEYDGTTPIQQKGPLL